MTILKRNGFKCKDCGKTSTLQVHHINRVKVSPRRFYDMKNVLTLCDSCHEGRHDEAQNWLWEDEEEQYVPRWQYVRCQYCGINYHNPKYKMCYSCHEEREKND